MGAVGDCERCLAHLVRDERADDEAQVGTAVLLGDVDHQQSLLARLLEQRRHHAGLLGLDRFGTRQHFALDEGGGGFLHEPLLVVELLGGQEMRLGDGLGEKGRALLKFDAGCHARFPPVLDRRLVSYCRDDVSLYQQCAVR